MYINVPLLMHHLDGMYHITMFRAARGTSFYSFRVYDGQEVEDHFLYIIQPVQLAFMERADADAAFLCVGVPEIPETEIGQDMLMVREDIDLADLVNILTGIFDFYNRWDNGLLNCTRDLAGIQKMLDISQPVLQGSIIIADFRFNYVAYTRDFEKNIHSIKKKYNGKTPPYIVDELLTDPEYFKVQNSHELFEYPIHDGRGTVPALCYNLFRENEEEYRARFLFVPENQPVAGWHGFLLKYLAEKVNGIYNQLSDFSMPFPIYQGLRTAIQSCIERKPTSTALLSQVLKYVHWNMDDRFQLLIFQPSFRDNTKEINAVSRTQLELMYQNSCALVHENCIVLLVNLTQNGGSGEGNFNIRTNLALFLRNNLYKAGISEIFGSFVEIRPAYREAEAALQLGNTKDNMFWYYQFSDYAMDYILNRCSEEIPREHLCQVGILRLMEYDRKNGTGYFEKLKAYVDEKFNISHAAEKLFIHRTTLLKHLKKIAELSNIDFDDQETRLHILLSMELLKR